MTATHPAQGEMDAQEYFAGERLRWSEHEFQKEVLALAKEHGWSHAYHSYFSKRSEEGFPDIVLVRPQTGELIFAELKAEKGRVTPAQQSWHRALCTTRSRGIGVFIWRPSDWNQGRIHEALVRETASERNHRRVQSGRA